MSSHAITNEVTGTGMVRRMGVKVMTEAQVERLRDVARAIIRDDFGGNQTATARHLGIAQSQFSGFINGTAGADGRAVVTRRATLDSRAFAGIVATDLEKDRTGLTRSQS